MYAQRARITDRGAVRKTNTPPQKYTAEVENPLKATSSRGTLVFVDPSNRAGEKGLCLLSRR